MTEPDPLQECLLGLHAALDESVPLIIAGGYGLYLKQRSIIHSGLRTLFRPELLPDNRTTHDIDLFLRAWQRGWGTVSVPEALIHHAVNASNNQTLSSLNLSVGERRYLSQRASLAIIALKYFSVRMLPLAALVWPAVFLNNLGSRRWGFARRDFRVLAEIARRAPGALAYRRTNALHNREMPGERFFTSPEFSDGWTAKNHPAHLE
jgi:hypothetical protein